MITSNGPMNTFLSIDESTGETVSVWTLFSHTGVYVMAIASLIPAGLGIFCCYLFWCQPARLVHQPLQSGSMQFTIVDYDVEEAPIYRCDGMAGQPTVRPCKNPPMTCVLNKNLHGWRVNRSSRFCPEQFLHQDHWDNTKIQGMQ